MECSLSVILPYFNSQATLRKSVLRVLEVVTDLTEQLDVMIVDNGSTDQTPEIAHDLAREYPQIVFRRFAAKQGLSPIVRSALTATHGEIILLHDGDGEINLADLRDLWQLRHDELLVLARSGDPQHQHAGVTLDQLLGQATERIATSSGFHLLRRDSLDLVRRGATLQVENQQVRLRHDLPRTKTASVASRPNFMSRLRRLALGE